MYLAKITSLLSLFFITITSLPAHAQEQFEAVLLPEIETVLSSGMSGYIQAIHFKEGQAFKENDLLVEFNCKPQEIELSKTQNAYHTAQKKLATTKELNSLKAASNMDLVLATTELEKTKLEKEQQEYMVEQCQILAPFDGIVTSLYVAPYQTVQQNSKLIQIINLDNPKLELFVSSDYLSSFQPGAAFQFSALETGKDYEAEVVSIVPRIDSVSRTFKVIGKLNEIDSALIPGISGTAQIDKTSITKK